MQRFARSGARRSVFLVGAALAVSGGSAAPNDPDGDGQYDDGNGWKDFADAVWLFNRL